MLRLHSGPEIGNSAERPENVADIIGRRDTLSKFAVPSMDNTFDNLNAGIKQVIDSNVEAVLVQQNEVFIGADTHWWSIEIRA